VRPAVDEKRSFCFAILTHDPKNRRGEWIFDAASEKDRDEWIDAIREASVYCLFSFFSFLGG